MRALKKWLNKAQIESTVIPFVKIKSTVFPIEKLDYTHKIYNDTDRALFFTNFNLPLIQQFRNFKNK